LHERSPALADLSHHLTTANDLLSSGRSRWKTDRDAKAGWSIVRRRFECSAATSATWLASRFTSCASATGTRIPTASDFASWFCATSVSKRPPHFPFTDEGLTASLRPPRFMDESWRPQLESRSFPVAPSHHRRHGRTCSARQRVSPRQASVSFSSGELLMMGRNMKRYRKHLRRMRRITRRRRYIALLLQHRGNYRQIVHRMCELYVRGCDECFHEALFSRRTGCLMAAS
jgi:hypothetical protein